MKNKSILLNILLSAVVLVLVYQLSFRKESARPESHKKVTEKVHKAKENPATAKTVKKSVGPKGWIMPKPALVIGSYGNNGEPNIMTAAWAGIANSDPMSIAISVRPSRKTYENIMATRFFTVNVPSARYVAHMDYVGTVLGRDEDKFKKLGLTPVKGDHVNAPYIAEFPIVIECEVTHTIELGTHTQFVGRVVDTKIDPDLLDEEGQVDIEKLQPVIFESGYYYGYGQRLGKPHDIYKLFKDNEEPAYTPVIHENPTLATIYNRKSVRRYTDRKVGQEQLTELTKAGMAAPTARDKRPWAFVAITDRSLLDKLADALPHAKMLKQATAAVVVCGDLDKALTGDAQAYWVQDCSAATQNILLAAESMGLGAVWTGVHPIKERVATVVELLNLPASIIPLNVIAVGYPTGEDKSKDKWEAANVHWDKW
ncbi:MAG: flavin reductase [Breznakibacter sp.]